MRGKKAMVLVLKALLNNGYALKHKADITVSYLRDKRIYVYGSIIEIDQRYYPLDFGVMSWVELPYVHRAYIKSGAALPVIHDPRKRVYFEPQQETVMINIYKGWLVPVVTDPNTVHQRIGWMYVRGLGNGFRLTHTDNDNKWIPVTSVDRVNDSNTAIITELKMRVPERRALGLTLPKPIHITEEQYRRLA